MIARARAPPPHRPRPSSSGEKRGLKRDLGGREGRRKEERKSGKKGSAHFDDDHRNDTAVVVVVVEKEDAIAGRPCP